MKMLEVASQEIDRFGWQMMDNGVKESIFENWCDELEPYSLEKIKSAIRLLFKKSKGNLRTINAFQVIGAIDEINRTERARLPKAPELEPERKPPNEASQARIDKLIMDAFPGARMTQQRADRGDTQ